MLNTPTQHRTEQEKLHLGKILGGLKCFRRYPPVIIAYNLIESLTFLFYSWYEISWLVFVSSCITVLEGL